MARRLPPFAAIKAFETAARHLSFKAAADELCVTPSAVSHQIRTLEEFLDTALFERAGNRLTLTHTGRAYQGRLTGLLDGLDDSTRAASARHADVLRVLSTPSFAARWLVPRLDRIPGAENLRLRVSEGAPSTDFARNNADVVIQWGHDPVPGVVVEPLMASRRYPVATPDLVRQEAIARPQDLLEQRLLRDAEGNGWAGWFRAAGVDARALPPGPRFAHCELVATAAERGQGVALVYDAVMRDTIAAGRLVRLFETVSLPRTIYSVAFLEASAGEARVRAFRDWLFAEVAAEGDLAPNAAAGTRAPEPEECVRTASKDG